MIKMFNVFLKSLIGVFKFCKSDFQNFIRRVLVFVLVFVLFGSVFGDQEELPPDILKEIGVLKDENSGSLSGESKSPVNSKIKTTFKEYYSNLGSDKQNLDNILNSVEQFKQDSNFQKYLDSELKSSLKSELVEGNDKEFFNKVSLIANKANVAEKNSDLRKNLVKSLSKYKQVLSEANNLNSIPKDVINNPTSKTDNFKFFQKEFTQDERKMIMANLLNSDDNDWTQKEIYIANKLSEGKILTEKEYGRIQGDGKHLYIKSQADNILRDWAKSGSNYYLKEYKKDKLTIDEANQKISDFYNNLKKKDEKLNTGKAQNYFNQDWERAKKLNQITIPATEDEEFNWWSDSLGSFYEALTTTSHSQQQSWAGFCNLELFDCEKRFSFYDDNEYLEAIFGKPISNQLCYSQVKGYSGLEKSENFGRGAGATEYRDVCDSSGCYPEVMADLRAQRTRVTPDKKMTLTYSFTYKNVHMKPLKIFPLLSYKNNKTSKYGLKLIAKPLTIGTNFTDEDEKMNYYIKYTGESDYDEKEEDKMLNTKMIGSQILGSDTKILFINQTEENLKNFNIHLFVFDNSEKLTKNNLRSNFLRTFSVSIPLVTYGDESNYGFVTSPQDFEQQENNQEASADDQEVITDFILSFLES